MTSSPESIVTKVDHVLVLADDADALFTLFSRTFGLPVAWPLEDYGGFASGGVYAGNVNLEFIRAGSLSQVPAPPADSARYAGIAFRPAGTVQQSIDLLQRRSIPHGAPQPTPMWTNIDLPDLLSGNLLFLCHYAPQVYDQTPRLAQQLGEAHGRPLGLVSVQEVLLAVPDIAAAQARWGPLLQPAPMLADTSWQVGDGPALRLEVQAAPAITRLTFLVRSVNTATSVLDSQGLLGSRIGDEVTLASARTGSLDMRIREQATGASLPSRTRV